MRHSQTSGHSAQSPGRVQTAASPLGLCSQGPPDATEVKASFPFGDKHLPLSGRRLGLSEAVNHKPHAQPAAAPSGWTLSDPPSSDQSSVLSKGGGQGSGPATPGSSCFRLGGCEGILVKGPQPEQIQPAWAPSPLPVSGSVPRSSARFQKQCSLKVKEADPLGEV